MIAMAGRVWATTFAPQQDAAARRILAKSLSMEPTRFAATNLLLSIERSLRWGAQVIRIGPPDPSQPWGVTAGSLAFAQRHHGKEDAITDWVIQRWWFHFGRVWRRIGKAMPK